MKTIPTGGELAQQLERLPAATAETLAWFPAISVAHNQPATPAPGLLTSTGWLVSARQQDTQTHRIKCI